jgi:hypothetical protein
MWESTRIRKVCGFECFRIFHILGMSTKHVLVFYLFCIIEDHIPSLETNHPMDFLDSIK